MDATAPAPRPATQTLACRSLNALLTTDTELKLMAAALSGVRSASELRLQWP